VQKSTAVTIQRVTHWNTGLAWEHEEIYGTVKGWREPILENFPDRFSDSVIPFHDNVRLGTCPRISIGKRNSIAHTSRIWHQAVFIFFQP
jgi:hypothetical protein